MVHFVLLLVFSLCVAARAANDWNTPCLQGQCSYYLSGSTNGSGTVHISGSESAISDITIAAGWMILDCDKDALAQDVRLVCQSDDTSAAGCDHLYQGAGAVGKLVRLPENCGKSAFARVSKAYVHENQTIPPSVAAALTRRDGAQPQVKGLSLDTNFSSIDPSQSGQIFITIQGSTVPGLTSAPSTFQRRSRLAQRGLVGSIKDAVDNINSFNANNSKTLPPIDVSKDFPLFNENVSCGAVDASIKADIDTTAHVAVALGVAASGTIVPPKLSGFSLTTGLTADFDGTLDIAASATGTLDSGVKTLFEVGLPGLDFPGILTLGPSFKINAQATATLDVETDLKVGLSYHVDNVQLFFPPSSDHQSGGHFSPGNTPLNMSVSPSVTATGTITAHLIPTASFSSTFSHIPLVPKPSTLGQLDLGLDALDGLAEATIFLELDASATLQLSLEASSNRIVSLNHHAANATASTTDQAPAYDASAAPGAPTGCQNGCANATNNARDVSSRLSGCIDIGSALDVNAGAEGSFLGLFDDETKINLFSKKFNLFHKCFSTAGNVKGTVSRIGRQSTLRKRVGLTCPGPGPSDLISVVNEALEGDSIPQA